MFKEFALLYLNSIPFNLISSSETQLSGSTTMDLCAVPRRLSPGSTAST